MQKKPTYEELNQRVMDLETELVRLKRALPVCPSCKKIIDDKNSRNLLEQYFQEHSSGQPLNYNLCSCCVNELYEVLSKI